MGKVNIKKILVIGDNHEEIAHDYSADKKVDEYVKETKETTNNKKLSIINGLERFLNDEKNYITSDEYDVLARMYQKYIKMSDDEYFDSLTEDCGRVNEDGTLAFTDQNPNAAYKYEKCYHKRYVETGEEATFSDPFPLKDGTYSYSAHFNDIDWDKIHKNKEAIDLYGHVWDMVVEDAEPRDEREAEIKEKMINRERYFFDNFCCKEDYVDYSTCIWFWGIATDEGFFEPSYKLDDLDWIKSFFNILKDKFVGDENPLITIYEVKSL